MFIAITVGPVTKLGTGSEPGAFAGRAPAAHTRSFSRRCISSSRSRSSSSNSSRGILPRLRRRRRSPSLAALFNRHHHVSFLFVSE